MKLSVLSLEAARDAATKLANLKIDIVGYEVFVYTTGRNLFIPSYTRASKKKRRKKKEPELTFR